MAAAPPPFRAKACSCALRIGQLTVLFILERLSGCPAAPAAHIKIRGVQCAAWRMPCSHGIVVLLGDIERYACRGDNAFLKSIGLCA